MNESFIQFLWKCTSKSTIFESVNGEKVEILQVGEHNTNAGPDFLNARIKINDTIWAGNIEIHIKSSDWHKHKHTNDPLYNSVILHVVAEYDVPIKRNNGNDIPCIVFPDISRKHVSYLDFQNNVHPIKCHESIAHIEPIQLRSWLEKVLFERLERKVVDIERINNSNRNNWEQTLFILLARSLGRGLNSDNFEILARSIPFHIVLKCKSDLLKIEALLFGMAGFLDEEDNEGNEYYQKLKNEFNFLKGKFSIQQTTIHWRFLRTRPVNFPTVRLAQLAALINNSFPLFSQIHELYQLKELTNQFEIAASEFWNTHYSFSKYSTKRPKRMGKSTINSIVINAVVPMLVAFAQHTGKHAHIEKAISFLEELPAESNSIVKLWQETGISCQSAFDTQALIQLKKVYCDKNRCLDCRIGAGVLMEKMHESV
jgi:hypothetical protein